MEFNKNNYYLCTNVNKPIDSSFIKIAFNHSTNRYDAIRNEACFRLGCVYFCPIDGVLIDGLGKTIVMENIFDYVFDKVKYDESFVRDIKYRYSIKNLKVALKPMGIFNGKIQYLCMIQTCFKNLEEDICLYGCGLDFSDNYDIAATLYYTYKKVREQLTKTFFLKYAKK